MSASKSRGPTEDVQEYPSVPLSVDTSQDGHKESSTPVPIAASSTRSRPAGHMDWSTSAPKPYMPSSPHLRAATFTPLPTEVVPPPRHSLLSPPQDSRPLSAHPFDGVVARHPRSPSRLSSFSFTHAPSSPTNTIVSPRTTVRRTSSIPDISPYLTDVPASATTLKHIALLESVADESARMTSIIHRKPSHGTHHSFRHSMAPCSVPPPSLVPGESGIVGAPLPSDSSCEPYHMRSRTSHACHPIPLNSQGANRNQDYLLGLMCNPGAISQVPHFYPYIQRPSFPPSMQGGAPASIYPNAPHQNPNSLWSILNNTRNRSVVTTSSMINGPS